MTAADELLRAVLDAPDDDGARLVYADWLLEQGDPRGELIQIQCALGDRLRARRQRANKAALTPELLAAREAALLAKHQRTWLEPIRPFIRAWTWKRGFVDSVVADGDAFLAGAATVFAHTPLEGAALTGLRRYELLAAVPELRRLSSLELSRNRIGPREAKHLHSANFANLRRLDLWGNPLGEEGGIVLAAAPSFDALRDLKLARCDLTADAVDALSQAEFFPRLTHLDLRNNEHVGPSAGEAVARGSSLTHLDLARTALGDAGLETLAASPAMKNLVELHLFGNGITERGVRALVDSPHLTSLRAVHGLVGYAGADSEIADLLRERFSGVD